MDVNISSYEENGRYYLRDAQGSIETTELINVDEMEYDECTGWIYHGKVIWDYVL